MIFIYLAAFPACKGLVVVPALAMGAPEKEAAIPRAARHLEGPNPRRLEQAAALPMTPTTAGGWNLTRGIKQFEMGEMYTESRLSSK